ncbi:MAG: hypothetical protein HN368_14090 [Spirochaetales bacterium]|jgi:hypothetical protein|nr:hypothetical protein [Spirochaetales bacterium]
MNKVYGIAITLILMVLALSGCDMLGIGGGYENSTTLAAIASAASEYNDEALVEALSSLDKDDYEEKGVGVKTLFVEDEVIRLLPNGTEVTITKTLDDGDTPADPEDDILTVYRQYDIWSGETKTETIIRPLKPAADWTGWDIAGQLVQVGTTQVEVDGFTIQEGTATATWQLEGTAVRLIRLENESSGIGGGGAVISTITEWDENGLQTRTRIRIRVTPDGTIETREFTFQEVEIDGEIYTKIIRDDGMYAIIISRSDPKITEYYTADGILLLITTVTRDPETRERTILRQRYDESGEPVGEPFEVNVSYRILGDTVIITRTTSNREITVVLKETPDGYEVTRGNYSYTVVFDGDDILLYNSDGSLIGTVTHNDDGTWSVVYPDGSEEIVSL